MYNFRINIIENITSVGDKIGSTFDKMKIKSVKFVNKLKTVPRSVDAIENELQQLEAQQRKSFSVREIRKLGRSIRSRRRELGRLNNITKTTTASLGKMGGMGSFLRSHLGGALAVLSISTIGAGIIDATVQYEKMEAVLTNSFGDNSAARRALAGVEQFAIDTPFQNEALQASFVKLVNRGFIPSQNEMTKLGDLASATGKDFDQLVEAMLDAETMEFERLKEFGIKAKSDGDKVILTFKGVQKTIKKTPEAMRAALLAFGAMDGVAGNMDAQMATTGGRISNMADSWDKVKRNIGAALAPLLAEFLPKVIEGLNVAADWVKENQDGLTKWIPKVLKISGIIGGILLTFNVITPIVAGAFTLWTALTAIWGGTFALALSPVTLVTLGIMAIGAAIYGLIKYWDEVKLFLLKTAQILWKLNPFSWMIELTDKIFPGFKDKLGTLMDGIKNTFKIAFDFVKKIFIDPVVKFFGFLFDGFGKIDEVTTPGVDSEKPEDDTPPKKGGNLGGNRRGLVNNFVLNQENGGLTDDFVNSLTKNLPGSDGKGAGAGAGLKGVVKNKVDNISTGGNIKNINISIQKLVETLNIDRSTSNQSNAMLKEEITRILLGAVNDTNYAL